MRRNVEIKARVTDPAALRERAEAIADAGPERIEQEDTFFPCARGRLKYRRLSERDGEWIHYERADRTGPTESCYRIVPAHDGHVLRDLLAGALGVRGVVRKRRTLFLAGPTRIHLDEVEGLGPYVELEVVLAEGQPREHGERIARERLRDLGIDEADLVEPAYVDLLERGGA